MLAALFIVLVVAAAQADSYVPSSDDAVLERLPGRFRIGNSSPTSPADAKAAPLNPEQIAAEVRAYLALARDNGDPRLLGHAQALLARVDRSKGELAVLHAAVLQRLHQFPAALEALDSALRANPADPQAWLLKTTILQVIGRYSEADAACRELEKVAPERISISARAALDGVTGKATESLATLENLIAQTRVSDRTERQWMLALASDIATRLGQFETAERFHKQAIIANPSDTFTLGAYTDFLRETKRPAEALAFVQRLGSSADWALLQEALARAELDRSDPALKKLQSELTSRFNAVRSRGDRSHLREEARFELHVQARPEEALALATENWNSQREAIDAAILLEAALAAKKPAAAQPVIAWTRSTRIEDQRLAQMIQALHPDVQSAN